MLEFAINRNVLFWDDFRFEYTECDAAGFRWRVSVPKKNPISCTGGYIPEPPKDPVVCTVSCKAGEFFNIRTQNCTKCPDGTYSTGGGIRHEDFSPLPDGFAIANEEAMPFYAETDEGGTAEQELSNCSSGGWRITDDGLLIYIPTPCISVLSYSVHLVRPGELKYSYLYPDSTDVVFIFQIQNEQCMATEDFYRRARLFPLVTPNGKFREQSISLKSGHSVITWRAIALRTGSGQPIFIRQISVSGLPFSGQCTPCPKGTHSTSGGITSYCTSCQSNMFASSKGSKSCQPCEQGFYSGPRSETCKPRPNCRTSDYYKSYDPCDSNGRTRLTYKWIEPKVCQENGGVQLPSIENNVACPSCYPGTHLVNGSCDFCPEEHYSDGRSGACSKCPANTAPNYGYYFNTWDRMPPRMHAECESMDDSDHSICEGIDTWIPMGNRISTGQVQRSNLYLSLSLEIPNGFRDPFSVSSSIKEIDVNTPVSHITFNFETTCTRGCGFYFIEQVKGVDEEPVIIAQWNGTWRNMSYTYSVIRPNPVSYGWIFVPAGGSVNEASIYSVRVENVIGGGASECRPCPIMAGSNAQSVCVSCPPGQYMTADSRQCVHCPNDTYLNVTKRIGIDACVTCGLNLRSASGVDCGVGDCQFNITGRLYDLSALKGFYQSRGVSIFGREGGRYLHTYNVSVCAAGGQSEKATCLSTIKDNQQANGGLVNGLICRTTAYPQEKDVLYANPLVLADQLVGVTDDPTTIVEGVNISAAPVGEWKWRQLYFVYRLRSSDGTGTLASKNCPKGRGALLIFRCDPAALAEKSATLSLPSTCPDGTCDGCYYTLLLTSPHACPRCAKSDYKRIVGECRDGQQVIHYIPNRKDCVPLADDEHSHGLERVPCSMLTFQIRVLIVGSVVLCIFLILLIVYVWKKNQRLEYKYMKLVESSAYGKEGELPAAETCGLQDDEDEEGSPEDATSASSERVVFSKGAWFRRKSAQKRDANRKGHVNVNGDDSAALAADDDYDDA